MGGQGGVCYNSAMFRRAQNSARPPLPLLITGIAGVPGYNALRYFQAKYPGQIVGIRQEANLRCAGPGVVVCNAEDRAGIAKLFRRHEFAAVLDCAGNCALRQCEMAPQLAWKINVEGVRNLLLQTVPRGIRLVHLSVDLVFSGDRPGGYVEEDPIDPVTVYGRTMAAAEDVVLNDDPAACILRISLPMGVSPNGHAGAIDWITSRFKKSRPATLYFDELRTPSYTDCMNQLYETMLAGEFRGIYHAGGPRSLTLYQIGQIINRVGGYRPECLMGIPRCQAGAIPPRAGNVTMNSRKLIDALGYEPLGPWPWSDALVPADLEWHYRRPAAEPGSPECLHRLLCNNPALPPNWPGRCLHGPEAQARYG